MLFGEMLLDIRLALGTVLVAAVMEAAVQLALGGRPAHMTGVGPFLRQRAALALLFVMGLLVYARLKSAYVYDPFFHSLYTFLLGFFLFFYVVSASSAVAGRRGAGGKPELRLHLMAALVLGAVALAKPQASTFGFLGGAAANLLGTLTARSRALRRSRLWLVVGLGLLLLAALTLVSR